MTQPIVPMTKEELQTPGWISTWQKKAPNYYIIGPFRIGKPRWMMTWGIYPNKNKKFRGVRNEKEESFLGTRLTVHTLEYCVKDFCVGIWSYLPVKEVKNDPRNGRPG